MCCWADDENKPCDTDGVYAELLSIANSDVCLHDLTRRLLQVLKIHLRAN